MGARRHTVALLASALILAAPALAHAVEPSTTLAVRPAAFVPDWDGHTDSTVVSYSLTTASFVDVRVIDTRGRTLRRLDRGRRRDGTHRIAWDGRDEAGTVLPPGTYRVQVTDRALRASASANTPGIAALTELGIRARRTPVRLQPRPVTLSSVRLDRTTISRARSATRATMRFHLSHTAQVAAAVVEVSTGRVVRNVVARRMPSGTNSIAWDGLTATGGQAGEGTYDVVIAATSGGRPTATLRVPIAVDLTAPQLRTSATTNARNARSGVMIPLSIGMQEHATVTLRLGRRSLQRTIAAGSHRIAIPGAQLGLIPTRRPRTVRITMTAVDGAGNTTTGSTSVRIPALPAATTPPTTPPPAPEPSPDDEAPTPGTLPWPVSGGIVTSEFGMRWGRPHTGIDIAVPTGTPVHPVADGTVSFVGSYGGYGNLVIVDHPGGLQTYYAHLSRFGAFVQGAAVTHVDVIGAVGCTGRCFGPHLHFETRVGGTPRPPREFLKAD